jgi:hypothetical protein
VSDARTPDADGTDGTDETVESEGADDALLERLGRATRDVPFGRLGPYEIRSTRRGGQGLVLEAVQPGTGRRVALKRVGSGVFSQARERRRFEREAEILCELDHPGIVRVFGLETIDDVPVLVMEWVDGVSFDAWCANEPRGERPLAERLACFLAVADAVHFAHQRGVIHRDLKPSNVLVDAQDRPRVLDFGLARRANASGDETLTLGYAGTPAYSAPECFTDGASAVGAQADVWSLGVMLYELLVGAKPFESRSFDGWVRAIRESEPAPPSRHRRGVPRDLDALTLRALAKSPNERYPTVAHFADDLRRFLAGAPVEARGRPFGYLATKWVLRNRFASASAAVALCAVAVASVTYVLQSQRVRGERNRVVEEQGRTREALRESEASRLATIDALAAEERAHAAAEEARTTAEAERAAAEAARTEALRLADVARTAETQAVRVHAFYSHHVFGPLSGETDGPVEPALVLARALVDDVPTFFADSPGVGLDLTIKLLAAIHRHATQGEFERRLAKAFEFAAENELAGTVVMADLLKLRGTYAFTVGRHAEARPDLMRAVEIFDAQPLPHPRPGAFAETLRFVAALDTVAGDLVSARANTERACRLLAEVNEDIVLYRDLRVALPCTLAIICTRAGDHDAAQVVLGDARKALRADATVSQRFSLYDAELAVAIATKDLDACSETLVRMLDDLMVSAPKHVGQFSKHIELGTQILFEADRFAEAGAIFDKITSPPFTAEFHATAKDLGQLCREAQRMLLEEQAAQESPPPTPPK